MDLTRRAIRAYCTLGGLKLNQNDDVIDALLPFTLPILQAIRNKSVSPLILMHGLRILYGWNIPEVVALTFRDRLLDSGYLRRESIGNTTFYFSQPPTEISESGEEIAISRALELIVDQFIEFPGRVSDLVHYHKDREQLADILIKFLISLNVYSTSEILSAVNGRNSQPSDDLKGLIQSLKEGVDLLTREDEYLCAKFIRHLQQNRPDLVEHLAQIAGVGLLTELVEDFRKPATQIASSNLFIVLDTPIAMKFLGLSGKEAKSQSQMIFQALTQIGCRFAVFKTSCDEIYRNLSAVLSADLSDRHGPTHTALISGELTREYAVAVRNNPEKALSDSGVSILTSDLNEYPNQHHHFSESLRNDFISEIPWVSIDGRYHDADCLALISRLRAGKRAADVFESKYVFISSNDMLVKRARNFCINHEIVGDRHCPPFVSEREMTMVAWVRTGMSSHLAIPRGRMLAACERVLGVRKGVIEKAKEKIRQARPDDYDQYKLLLTDARTITKLHDQVLGNEDNISEESAEKLISDMTRELTIVLEQAHSEEKKRLIAKQAARTRELKVSHDNEKKQFQEQISQYETERLHLLALKDKIASEQERARRTAKRKLQIIKAKNDIFIRKMSTIIHWNIYVIAGLSLLGVLLATVSVIVVPVYIVISSIILASFGTYYTITDLLGKSKINISTLLNFIAKIRFKYVLFSKDLLFDRNNININFENGRIVFRSGSVQDE